MKKNLLILFLSLILSQPVIPDSLKSLGSYGSGQYQWQNPGALLVYGSAIYVADVGNNRVVKLDNHLNWKFAFGDRQNTQKLSRPQGIARGVGQSIWVADGDRNILLNYANDGTFLKKIGEFSNLGWRFNDISGIASDTSNTIYVADKGNDRVVVLRSNGEFLSDFGQTGPFNQRLSSPTAIALNSNNELWVADLSEFSLKLFDQDGHFIRAVTLGQPMYITAILPDSEGLWLADVTHAQVIQINHSGTVLKKIDVKKPTGLAILGNQLLVSDQSRSAILVFAIR